jgi:hypothetical protein
MRIALLVILLVGSIYLFGFGYTFLGLAVLIFLAYRFLRWIDLIVLVLVFSPLLTRADVIEDTPECQDEDCEIAKRPEPFQPSCIGGNSEACSWTTLDYTLQATMIALSSVDWVLTHRNLNKPWFTETNPILGLHPSRGKVAGAFILTLSIHTIVAAVLPRPYRTAWQAGAIGIETGMLNVWYVSIRLAGKF